MPLIKCRECKAPVSTKAKACSKCGARTKSTGILSKIVLALVGLLIIIAFTSGKPPPPKSSADFRENNNAEAYKQLDYSKLSDADARLQVHDAVTRHANQRGETELEFARRVGSTPEKIEALVFAFRKAGGTAADTLKSLEGFSQSLQDPQKVKLLECLGIKIYDESQPSEHPPNIEECTQIKEQIEQQSNPSLTVTNQLEWGKSAVLSGIFSSGVFTSCCIAGKETKQQYYFIQLEEKIDIVSRIDDETEPTIRNVETVQLGGASADFSNFTGGQRITISCKNLWYGNTGHYALPVYCTEAKIKE